LSTFISNNNQAFVDQLAANPVRYVKNITSPPGAIMIKRENRFYFHIDSFKAGRPNKAPPPCLSAARTRNCVNSLKAALHERLRAAHFQADALLAKNGHHVFDHVVAVLQRYHDADILAVPALNSEAAAEGTHQKLAHLHGLGGYDVATPQARK